MQEMILINPRKKRAKKRTTKKRVKRRSSATPKRRRTTATRKKRTTRRAAPKTGARTMAKRRKTYRRKSTARKNPAPRRRRRAPRRNPRRSASRARSTFAGLNIKSALKDQLPMLVGMFGAKWAAKRFGEAASETDPSSWNYMSYIKAGIGAVASAWISNQVKRGSGQKVLTGGLAYVAFKLVENELIIKSEWAVNQFGAEEYYPSEYLSGADEYEPGDIEVNSVGQPYMLGDDYQWKALPESMSGEQSLAPITRLGDAGYPLEPVSNLGASDDATWSSALLS